MKLKTLSMVAIATTYAAAAQSEGVQYLSYGGSFTNLSANGESVDFIAGGIGIDYRTGDLTMNGGFNRSTITGNGEDDTSTALDGRVAYDVIPGLAVYGGLSYFDETGFDTFTSYNLGAEYQFDGFTVGLNYEDSDDAGAESITRLYGSYAIGGASEVGVFITDQDGFGTVTLGADYNEGPFDVSATFSTDDDDFNIFGIDATYAFGNGFRAGGNYVDFGGDATLIALSGGYELSTDLWVDLSAGSLDADGTTIDTLGLALTFETGRESLLIDRGFKTLAESVGILGQGGSF